MTSGLFPVQENHDQTIINTPILGVNLSFHFWKEDKRDGEHRQGEIQPKCMILLLGEVNLFGPQCPASVKWA